MLALLAGLLGGTGAASPPACGDFLERLHRKPAYLQLSGCQQTHEAQVRVLEAFYRVPGPRAAQAEGYLTSSSGMPKLKFACCGWEVPGYQFGRFNTPGGQPYFVQMGSGETIYSRRADWPKINFFNIRVISYLEEP